MNSIATPINYATSGTRIGNHQYNQPQHLQTPTRSGPSSATPHVQTNRRGPGPMVTHQQAGHQPLSQAQLQHQQAQARALELEQAKRRARKPTDKTISSAIEDIAPLAKSYSELREMERRLDATIMRKRLDVQDSVARNIKTHRTLRMFISNTAINQPWQATSRLDETSFDFDTGLIPSYRMKIEGRLLDDDENPAHIPSEIEGDKPEAQSSKAAGEAPREEPSTPAKKFSAFFKTISVEMDRTSLEHFPEGSSIEWHKPAPPALNKPGPATAPVAEFDGFEFERKIDINTICTIKLFRDEYPERFKLSPELADVLDTTEDSRAGILMGIWEYALVNNLQEREERRSIQCDEKLRRVFNQEKIFLPAVTELVTPHLRPIDPITIKYMIKVDIATTTPVVYDILVPEDDPIRLRMLQIINSQLTSPSHRNLIMEDENIAVLVQAINHSKAKRDFWTSLGTDPASFIQRWVSSQKRDLEVILGEKGVDNEEGRRADFYNRDIVAENAYLLLHGKYTPSEWKKADPLFRDTHSLGRP